jgi:hypothetical protein
MKRLALAALAALSGILAGTPQDSHSTTFYAGMDRALTDSAIVAPLNGIPKPAHNVTVTEPFSGARMRIVGDPGTAVLGSTGGTWYRDARHHYSKDQPWSRNMKWLFRLSCG